MKEPDVDVKRKLGVSDILNTAANALEKLSEGTPPIKITLRPTKKLSIEFYADNPQDMRGKIKEVEDELARNH